MEQNVVKEEIDIHDDFVCNINVKQELVDEVPTFQNVVDGSKHHIKREINYDLNPVQVLEEPMIADVTKEDTFHEVKIEHDNIENEHLRTGEKSFKCDICLKSFSSRSGFRRHSLTHTGKKPIKCDICSVSFLWMSELKRHLLIHGREKLFKCHLCGKSLSQKGDFKRHLHGHTGEKPFRCDICLKTFSEKRYLKDHSFSHREVREKPFQCDICLKSFLRKCQLLTHSRSHTGEKPYRDHCLEVC
ncbi:zinc finger protein-like [Diorhabda sublineata]|uniref:zinc finger protein-like n=1 Tax=Diorhabda sublineata TaxID=1163346 RepID=UPI0024E1707D|nr:zinc finger protein-like [Diorhabda sublineata]